MGRGVLEFGPFVRETSLEKIKSEWTESEELALTRLIVPPTALQMAKEGGLTHSHLRERLGL